MTDRPKTYDASRLDPKWSQFWEAGGFFQANPLSSKPPYCIVIPPPNVTGVLHMGHAIGDTLQDILIRWKRMLGCEVLWVPGTDHAGIATQTVVERHLIASVGKRRTDYSREEFLSLVWEWKEKNEAKILEQIKRLGCSCDWSRLRFTMDEGNNLAVKTMFKKLYDAGIIYRGDYLVNWDPITQTALADDEVEHEEYKSSLWYIDYPFSDGSGKIQVATTRPETMLGDTAVAVSSQDSRYTSYIGKSIRLPLTDRIIPLITDHRVDPAFGTGAVKITPAHDPNDYQIGKDHHLPFITIMTPDGRINENGGQFEGLTMPEARNAVVKELKRQGYLAKIEPHVHRVGVSYRSKAIIEPYLSTQWFIRMGDFTKKLRDVIHNGSVRLIPSHWENTYFYWIDHLRDWCISRQLWWGHRIPIWYHKDDPKKMICEDGLTIPEEIKQSPEEWIQDPDVLDTWFSSALWPFSTLGWPKETAELKKFYPNATLVTGHDILFFWVARMLCMGEYAMNTTPFPECFLHGLIYGKSYWRTREDGSIAYVNEEERLAYDLGKVVPSDVSSKWEKMSKSKGNIIDPIEMIDQYGADAVRMALCASATQARQIDLDRRRFEEFKNFTNKIWNGSRFVLLHLESSNQMEGLSIADFSCGIDESLIRLEDRWIFSTLSRTIAAVHDHLTKYEFDQAAHKAYEFFWKEFCAYYVEISKPVLFGKQGNASQRKNKQRILLVTLCQAIRLLHPMAPFITEELFHLLKELFPFHEVEVSSLDPYTSECIQALQAPCCAISPFPQRIAAENSQVLFHFACMEEIIYTIRNIRGEMKLPPGQDTDIYIVGNQTDEEWNIVQNNQYMIQALIRTKKIEMTTKEPVISFGCIGICRSLKIILPLPQDLLEQEIIRLTKERDKISLQVEKIRSQLSNPDFVNKAPPQLVAKQQQLLLQGEKELEEITSKLLT